jgi:hypothetical protein
MSMRRSDVDNATPRVTRVEALSRVSPGFPPCAISYAGASTVVPLVHSPLVSPLSDSPCPVPAPGRVRVALGPVSACGGPPRGPAFSGPTCTTGAYRERAMESLIENTHMPTLPTLGHHSRFRVPRTLSSQTVCVTIELRHDSRSPPRDVWTPRNARRDIGAWLDVSGALGMHWRVLGGAFVSGALETSYRYRGPRRGNCSLVATPWRRRSLRQPCSCASFLCRCVPHSIPGHAHQSPIQPIELYTFAVLHGLVRR